MVARETLIGDVGPRAGRVKVCMYATALPRIYKISLAAIARSLTSLARFLAGWAAVHAEVDTLLTAYRRLGVHLIVVSNEVGLGVVPPYSLGRTYRDCLGRANQTVARIADRVILMVAGLPLDLKALSQAWPD